MSDDLIETGSNSSLAQSINGSEDLENNSTDQEADEN